MADPTEPSQVNPPVSRSYLGTWGMRLEGKVALVLHFDQATEQSFVLQPAYLSTTNGRIFFNIQNCVVKRKLRSLRFTEAGIAFERVTRDADEESTAAYEFSVGHDGFGYLHAAKSPLPAWRLSALRDPAVVATDWEPNRAYSEGGWRFPNAELTCIFDADQADRGRGTDIEGLPEEAGIAVRDQLRRGQVRALAECGAIQAAEDFEKAALVMQHGLMPADFLLAHALSLAAVARGRVSAVLVATAALDRYLTSIGERQVFGSQARMTAGELLRTEMNPVIPQAVRKELGLPYVTGRLSSAKGIVGGEWADSCGRIAE